MASNDNALEVGESRIGLMIDGLLETPPVAVKVERTEKRVEVTIPFLDGHRDIYRYWFSTGIMFGDDPDRSKRRYEPPETLSVYTAKGPVGLVGSRAVGSTTKYGVPAIGEGRLTFDFTILGARSGADYGVINGLRSEIEGLGTWVGLRSLDAEQELEDGRLTSVNLRLKSPTPLRAGRRLNAQIRANWRYGPGPEPDQTTIAERMQLHTEVKRATTWEEHLRVHFRLRELLRVASWTRLNFVSHEAMSFADPVRTADGKAHGNQWFPVITHRTGIAPRAEKLTRRDFLFSYGDVASRGVGRWIDLGEKFDRALAPLARLVDIEGASLEAHLAQVGIGFEMLGHDLLIEGGATKTQAKGAMFIGQVHAVSSLVADVLPFPVDEFPDLLRRTYVGVKHADRERPDGYAMQLAYWQAIQVFRAWVALRLGVAKPRLREALKYDNVTRHIQAIERDGREPGGVRCLY